MKHKLSFTMKNKRNRAHRQGCILHATITWPGNFSAACSLVNLYQMRMSELLRLPLMVRSWWMFYIYKCVSSILVQLHKVFLWSQLIQHTLSALQVCMSNEIKHMRKQGKAMRLEGNVTGVSVTAVLHLCCRPWNRKLRLPASRCNTENSRKTNQ